MNTACIKIPSSGSSRSTGNVTVQKNNPPQIVGIGKLNWFLDEMVITDFIRSLQSPILDLKSDFTSNSTSDSASPMYFCTVGQKEMTKETGLILWHTSVIRHVSVCGWSGQFGWVGGQWAVAVAARSKVTAVAAGDTTLLPCLSPLPPSLLLPAPESHHLHSPHRCSDLWTFPLKSFSRTPLVRPYLLPHLSHTHTHHTRFWEKRPEGFNRKMLWHFFQPD